MSSLSLSFLYSQLKLFDFFLFSIINSFISLIKSQKIEEILNCIYVISIIKYRIPSEHYKLLFYNIIRSSIGLLSNLTVDFIPSDIVCDYKLYKGVLIKTGSRSVLEAAPLSPYNSLIYQQELFCMRIFYRLSTAFINYFLFKLYEYVSTVKFLIPVIYNSNLVEKFQSQYRTYSNCNLKLIF